MAEIRKFDPAAGNAIAQALREAMGDPVRPVTPGEANARRTASAAPEEQPSTDAAQPTTWRSFTVTRKPAQ